MVSMSELRVRCARLAADHSGCAEILFRCLLNAVRAIRDGHPVCIDTSPERRMLPV